MQWKNIIAVLAMVLLVGCGGETPESTQNNSVAAISDVSVDNTLQTSDKRIVNVDVHIQSNAEVQDVPLAYYLVSTDQVAISKKVIDENTTETVSEPAKQYYIGSDSVNLNSQEINKELNITLPSNVEEGDYKVAVFIDPTGAAKLAMPDNIPLVESNTPIHVPKVVNDVELVSLSFDNPEDNVLIIKNDNVATLLNMTAVARSNGEDIDGCYFTATLKLNGESIPLEFFGDELKDPFKFDISKLSQVNKHVSLEIKVPKELKEELLTSLGDAIYNAEIAITLVSNLDNEPLENNTKDIALLVYKKVLTKTSYVTTPADSVLLKSFSKNFSAEKKDDNFGIGLNENVDAHFSTLDSGVSSRADLNARVLGNDYSVLGLDIEGFVQYDSFENTGYSIVLKVFGVNVFTKSDDMASMAQGVPKAKLTDEEKATLTRDEQDELLVKKQIEINADPDNMFSFLEYTKDFATSKSLSVTQVIPVSIVHVDVTAGLEGEMGFYNAIKLDGILSLSANSGPKTSLTGFASGGIGIAGFEAGIRGSYTFVSNYFRGESNFQFVFSGDANDLRLKGILSEKVINTFEGPKGSLDVYVIHISDKYCTVSVDRCMATNPFSGNCQWYVKEEHSVLCGVTREEFTRNIFSWDSQKSTDVVLLDESVVLSDNKIY